MSLGAGARSAIKSAPAVVALEAQATSMRATSPPRNRFLSCFSQTNFACNIPYLPTDSPMGLYDPEGV